MPTENKLTKTLRVSQETGRKLRDIKPYLVTYDQIIRALMLYKNRMGGTGKVGVPNFDATLAEVTS